MLSNTLRAPLSDSPSNRGLVAAVLAAWTARASPCPSPMPIMAVPAPLSTAATSAKSRFTIPGTVMRSLIPWTPVRSTSSASSNALVMGTPGAFSMSLSFWMTMITSTSSLSFSRPSSARCMRTGPSNANGKVTTPTVRAPASRARCAITGAAPVPVPPPRPQVRKTRWAPLTSFSTSQAAVSAA